MKPAPRILVPYRHVSKVTPYAEALRAAGLDPVLFETNQPGSLDGVAGLLLTGGTDIDPERYGQQAVPETDAPDRERDAVEADLLDEAIQRDMPVLAICRGMQLMNVCFGGTLIQHLGSAVHKPNTTDRTQPAHRISIKEGSLLARIMGVVEAQVNSRHHQAVGEIGSSLRVCATEDGVVEGLERPDKSFVLGVQWHPEDQIRQPEQLRLFSSLGGACSRH